MRTKSISLDEHGSNIRNVSRCRPAVSDETKELWNYEISATTQEFILKKKVGPIQSITELSYCLINAALLNVYFMLH